MQGSGEEDFELTLITCYMTTGLALVELSGGVRRLLKHEGADYVQHEGERGIARIRGDVLVEFRPHRA